MSVSLRVLCCVLLCGVVGCDDDEASPVEIVETGDCSITVRSPESGDEFCTQQIVNVWWQSEFVGETIDVALYDGDRLVRKICDHRPNRGSVSLSADLFGAAPGDSFRYRVSDSEDPACGGRSECFTIYDPLQCELAVTYPTGPDTTRVLHGDPMTITWDASGASDYVDIELIREGGLPATIASHVPNTGSYDWTVAARHCGERAYYLWVRDTLVHNDDGRCEGASGRVNIAFAEGDEYDCEGAILAPLGGETWARGQEVMLSFTASNFVGDKAGLRLFHEGEPVAWVVKGCPIRPGINFVAWVVETGGIGAEEETFTIVLSDDGSTCCFIETPPITISGWAP